MRIIFRTSEKYGVVTKFANFEHLFQKTMSLSYFAELNVDDIKGYVILLDVDGTLTHDRLSELEKATVNQIEKLKKNNIIYLCSNYKNHGRNEKIAELTNVEYLKTDLRKPSRNIVKLIKTHKKKPFFVIGDKFLADGLFARRIGAKFIKVKRLVSYKDGTLTKLTYVIDDIAAKLFS